MIHCQWYLIRIYLRVVSSKQIIRIYLRVVSSKQIIRIYLTVVSSKQIIRIYLTVVNKSLKLIDITLFRLVNILIHLTLFMVKMHTINRIIIVSIYISNKFTRIVTITIFLTRWHIMLYLHTCIMYIGCHNKSSNKTWCTLLNVMLFLPKTSMTCD